MKHINLFLQANCKYNTFHTIINNKKDKNNRKTDNRILNKFK